DLAHSLRANPANSQVCHTAIPETQARISDVFRGAEHGNADRIDAGDRRFHKSEHYIEIVYHQIEHDTDVGAASGIRREAMGLDEARLCGHGLKIFEHGIESFHVADLQHAALFPCQLYKLPRLGSVIGHR